MRQFRSLAGTEDVLFLQGACGDTTTNQNRREDFAGIEAMGRGLAEAAHQGWQKPAVQSDVQFAMRREVIEVPHRSDESQIVRLEVTVLRLSRDVVMVFWPSEPYIELSLQVQWRSPFARTIVAAYSHGWVGYIPHRNAYEFGGYGAEAYTKGDGTFKNTTGVPVGTGEVLIEKTLELIEELNL